MAKRIIMVIVVVLIILGITSYAYSHYRDRRVESGEVVDEAGTVVGSNGSAPVRTPTRSDATDSGSDDAPGPQSRRTAFSPTTVLPMQSSMNSAPVTDTISPNPPNGTVFAGTGKYQVYRQGDLTWRVNTADGTTCILFATEEQWRRPVVYRNACPRG